MAHTEDDYDGVSGGFVWKALNTLLGAAGTATGITALPTKVTKNNCGCNGNYHNGGGTVVVENGFNAPSAFQAWSKSCEDAIELTKAFYDARITQLGEARNAREIDIAEKF